MKKMLSAMAIIAIALPAVSRTDTVKFAETIVTGTRSTVLQRDVPATVSVVTRDKLTENYRPSLLPTLTEQVPGLFVTSRGVMGYGVSTGAAGTIKIRGIGGMAQMLVLVDGLPQYAGLYGHPIPDAYHTMLADRVEVLRGPASLIYGSNAMGGVLNIVTRQLGSDGLQNNIQTGWGSYGTFQSEYNSIFRQGKLSGAAGLAYNSTDGHRRNSQFKESNAFLKLGYDFSPHWQARAMGNLNWSAASNPGPLSMPLEDNDMRILRGMASASLENHYDRTNGALRTFLSWGHHHINDGYNATLGTPRSSLYLHNDFMLGVSLYQGLQLLHGNTTTIGFDWQQLGGHAWNRTIATGEETDIIRKTENDFAGYLDFRQTLLPWMTLDAGLRADYHTQAGLEWIPQGGLTFRLAPQAHLSTMVSKGFRNPTVKDLYMYRVANADLQPERMMNYEISYRQHLLDGRMRAGASLFYLDAENIISTEMRDGRMQNVNSGKLQNWGVELESVYRLSAAWQLNGNYSFLHMKHPVVAAPRHKLYLGANWQKNKLSLNGGLQYIEGLYTTVQPEHQTESFCLLNFTATYLLTPNFRLYARGENLLAQCYCINEGFHMPHATFMAGVNISF